MSVESVSKKARPPAPAPAASSAVTRGLQAVAPAGPSFGSVLAKRRAAHGAPAPAPHPVHREEVRPPATGLAPPTPAPVQTHGRDPRWHDGACLLDRQHSRTGKHGDQDESPLAEHARQAAQLAPPPDAASLPPTTPLVANTEAHRSSALATVLPQLVKQIAWQKENPRKGAVRMEFGGGALAGGSMLVQSDNGHVAVRLELPPGESRDEWRARVQEALARRGHHAADVDVT